ncbi:unnamed protein product, partial [Mesorhabditis belari]|uniref:Uncharacterized protein n=1 Tax=Mesorhabditis belari TaxID=2138241 RepID=A0AAF3EH37_9BILA
MFAIWVRRCLVAALFGCGPVWVWRCILSHKEVGNCQGSALLVEQLLPQDNCYYSLKIYPKLLIQMPEEEAFAVLVPIVGEMENYRLRELVNR